MSEQLQAIEAQLEAVFQPDSITLIDESHNHVGHAGAKAGGGHFALTIVSAKFTGVNAVARHRLIYDALSGMMSSKIHALSIQAFSPDEL